MVELLKGLLPWRRKLECILVCKNSPEGDIGDGGGGNGTITETEKGAVEDKDIILDQNLTQDQSFLTVVVITIITFNTFTKTI